MEKRYIIKESLLLDLLAESERADALEAGGVDNWCYYGEAVHEALGKQYESFDDLAKDTLNKYVDNNEIIAI